MTTVSPEVQAEIRQRLGARAEELIRGLERTPLPMLDDEKFARDRDRVHRSVMAIVESDWDRLEYHLEVAATDWRDTLIVGERILAKRERPR